MYRRISRGLSTRNFGVALAAGMSMTVHARERSESDIPMRWPLLAESFKAPPEEYPRGLVTPLVNHARLFELENLGF